MEIAKVTFRQAEVDAFVNSKRNVLWRQQVEVTSASVAPALELLDFLLDQIRGGTN